MVEQGGGAIVNVASVNAFFQPDAGTIDYGAAKAALLNLSKSLAQEFGPKGIHVNCVSPGPVATELWLGDHGVAATVAAASGVDADTARANVVASIGGFATGRFTTPEEVATLVVLLASDRTANVTGANYVIDGGLIKTDLRRHHAQPTTRGGDRRPARHARRRRRPHTPRKTSATPTVVLVHGAFADASGWSGVIDRLEDRGYPVLAPANPLRGVAADAAYLRSFLATVPGRSCSSATPTAAWSSRTRRPATRT